MIDQSNLTAEETVYALSNEELASAIGETWEMLHLTGEAYSERTDLKVHFKLLLDCQYKRACREAIK